MESATPTSTHVGPVPVLSANVWILPYQFTTYVAFWNASEGRLFAHHQARAYAIGYLVLCVARLLCSVPLWRGLGLIR